MSYFLCQDQIWNALLWQANYMTGTNLATYRITSIKPLSQLCNLQIFITSRFGEEYGKERKERN